MGGLPGCLVFTDSMVFHANMSHKRQVLISSVHSSLCPVIHSFLCSMISTFIYTDCCFPMLLPNMNVTTLNNINRIIQFYLTLGTKEYFVFKLCNCMWSTTIQHPIYPFYPSLNFICSNLCCTFFNC